MYRFHVEIPEIWLETKMGESRREEPRRPQFYSREEREAYPRAPGLASRAFLSIARTNSRLSRYHEIIHVVPLPPPPPPAILYKYPKYSF